MFTEAARMGWLRGTSYGHRTSRAYNRVKVAQAAREEGRPIVLLYFAERLRNDDRVVRFVLTNGHRDPSAFVESKAPDGSRQRWLRFEEDGRSVFVPPDGYVAGPIAFVHDRRFTSEALVYESTTEFFDLGRN